MFISCRCWACKPKVWSALQLSTLLVMHRSLRSTILWKLLPVTLLWFVNIRIRQWATPREWLYHLLISIHWEVIERKVLVNGLGVLKYAFFWNQAFVNVLWLKRETMWLILVSNELVEWYVYLKHKSVKLKEKVDVSGLLLILLLHHCRTSPSLGLIEQKTLQMKKNVTAGQKMSVCERYIL